MKRISGVLGALCTCVLASSAYGAKISSVIFELEARSEIGTAIYTVKFAEGNWDEANNRFTWELKQPVSLYEPLSGELITTIRSARVRVFLSSVRRTLLDIGIDNGDADTFIVVRTPMVCHEGSEGSNLEGAARASFGVKDKNGDGAVVCNVMQDGMFLAQFNGTAPLGSTFTALVGSIECGPGGSGSASQSYPVSGYAKIDAPIRDFSGRVSFMVSASDACDGSTSWAVRKVNGGGGDRSP
jgi:hypothetical protein